MIALKPLRKVSMDHAASIAFWFMSSEGLHTIVLIVGQRFGFNLCGYLGRTWERLGLLDVF